MHEILKMNIKTLEGKKPFTVVDHRGWSGQIRKAVFDKNNFFMGFMTLTGNSKQRAQQKRAFLKEMNQ